MMKGLCCILLVTAGLTPFISARKLVEFRIPLPFDVNEYEIGQRLSTLKFEEGETGGGEGVEIVTNEPFNEQVPVPPEVTTSGQYTLKIWYLKNKVPSFVRLLAPKGSLEIMSKSWNHYPAVDTTNHNGYMKQNFNLMIRSRYVAGDCNADNIFGLSTSDLSIRRIESVDIVNDRVDPTDYKESDDPTKCTSTKTNMTPLDPNWKSSRVTMCAYKLMDASFRWFGLQTRVESMIERGERRYMQLFHRRSFCWRDDWSGMSMNELLVKEEEAKQTFERIRNQGEVRGMSEN